ncbi:hypothetical protein [Nocardia jejuensis]|nr:hypothetical protein [Nocardia jejuensis]
MISDQPTFDSMEVLMLTTVLNWILAAWGNVAAGSSGYQIPPGSLPFGS